MQEPFIPPKISFLLVNQKQKTRIPIQSIVMLEGHINYTLIYLENGNKKLYAKCLGHFEDLLINAHFLRVHRGIIVNPSFIVSYDKEGGKLRLENNLEVNIARRRRWCMDFLKIQFAK
jgi:two-component system, LytTR family, response regulator